MIKYLTSIILIGISVTLFFLFASPFYESIGELKIKKASYAEALDNAKALEEVRDQLTKKFSTISPENLERIKKLLPDNVDNIRLILEIEKIAAPYGMALKDVQYSVVPKESRGETASPQGEPVSSGRTGRDQSSKQYGSWDLGFSTASNYHNFINFMKDLENNLRIVDISTIQFSSETGNPTSNLNSRLPEVYRYSFKIKTYWLKN